MAPELEVEWFAFTKKKKFALLDLNDKSNTIEFSTAIDVIQDSYKMLATVDDCKATHIREP